MQIYDELIARGLLAQVTDEDEIRDLVNNGKASGKERNRFISGIQRTLDDTRTLRKKKAWLRFIIVQ